MLERTIFDEEHHQFCDAVRRFFAAELTPNIARWEASGQVDKEFWRACGAQGVLCPDMPEPYGGAGLDFRANAIVLEETSFTGSAAPTFGLHSDIVAHYVLKHANETVRSTWLPRMAEHQPRHLARSGNTHGTRMVRQLSLIHFYIARNRTTMSNFEDILYEVEGRTATITINRPEKYNAFRPRTVVELIDAFMTAGWDQNIGSIVFTGAGGKAFCTGGDQSDHEGGQYGNNDARGAVGMPVDEFHSVLRDIPKPVIAKVRGYAIGGGNVFCTICDLTIASDNAVFGQVGPKMGSVDPGFGTAYLARVVGEKKAREMWYVCKRYSAEEALAMGLVNAVVPDDQLDAEVQNWCDEINQRSPTAIALAKKSFNTDTEAIRGVGQFAMQALRLYYNTEESQEGVKSLMEKREPDFMKYYR